MTIKEERLVKFDELGLSKDMLNIIKKKGFKHPSEIQEKIIPIILENKNDVIGLAQTGTGKTGAFGLPIMDILNTDINGELIKNDKNPRVIILAPTRELAQQVSNELSSFKNNNFLKILSVYGGTAINSQIKDLRSGVDIIVGTPGRIIDLINRRILDLSNIEYFILDEADEMLKMGFIDDIEEIFKTTPKNKRVLLFSATMPEKIKILTKKYMKKQLIIEIAKKSIKNKNIEQIYFKLKQSEKLNALKSIIDFSDFFYGIIFCQTKSEVDEISSKLRKFGFKVDCIHGDIAQNKRERVLQKFRDMKIEILVATDVAARGIDIKDLTNVVNYSLPKEDEIYVHRIGRTGRAGKTGIAYSFISPRQEFIIKNLEKITNNKIKKGILPTNKDLQIKKEEKLLKLIENRIKDDNLKRYFSQAEYLLNNYDNLKIISSLLALLDKNDYNENYNFDNSNNFNEFEDIKSKYFSNKNINKNNKNNKNDRNDRNNINNYNKNVRLFIAKGKLDKFNKKQLLYYLEKESGINRLYAKDVKIFDKFSFISVSNKVANKILNSFEIGNKRPIVEIASKK